MKKAKSTPALNGKTRHERLREVACKRLERLENKANKIHEHLKRKPGDLQAMHFLLHKVLVQSNDMRRNLENKEWEPKPKRKREKKSKNPLPTPIPPLVKTKGLQPGPQTHVIQPPQPLPSNRDKDLGKGEGRDWCCASFVELSIPIGKEKKLFDKLEKKSNKYDKEVVGKWAKKKFGSIPDAKEELKRQATLPEDAAVWRDLIKGSKRSSEFMNFSNDELLSDKDARNIARKRHEIEWTTTLVQDIKSTLPKEIDKDSFGQRLEAHLSSFHSAVNRGKHTNPQFPFLSEEESEEPDILAEIDEWFNLPLKERYDKDPLDEKKRPRIKILQQDLGKLKRAKHWRGTEKNPPWANREHYKATTSRRREGALLWDTKENRFVFAIPIGGEEKIDESRYIYIDGKPLSSDNQLTGKSCLILPLKPKHGFLRWYDKHVENHNPDAPLHRRCAHFCTQYILIPQKGTKPAQIFIRPVFKFLDENDIEVRDTHNPSRKPSCRYLIGIDRGINYPYRAIVLDSKTNTVVRDYFIKGRKDEMKQIQDRIAYHQSLRDTLSNSGAKQARIQRHDKAIRNLRKKERGLNKVEIVESIAGLVTWAERICKPGNYCFVVEKLDQMNLRKYNRVKHIAAIKDALLNQMRKRGYKYAKSKNADERVDGLREERPFATSQISPSGWHSKEAIEQERSKDKSRWVGREIGKYYCCEPDANDLYHRGEFAPPSTGGRGKVLWVKGAEYNSNGQRWRTFRSELFWDPTVKRFAGVDFPHGIVLDADFVGAFNIALRPLVRHGKDKGFGKEQIVEAHKKLNPTIKFDCKVVAYQFVEVGSDPRGALRKINLKPNRESFVI